MANKQKEIKSIQIKFYDNDFRSAAYAAMRALEIVLDLTTEPVDNILTEFKFLIHHLANTQFRLDKQKYPYKPDNQRNPREVKLEYFDRCTVVALSYVPKGWFNSETILYDFDNLKILML